mmetsp:Transcript_81113/g.204204  ORF Transcript_81113/g.204204 Transcript_81113/m.204204 type:complete len:237 (+) Transcript_81113:173-883(+)
MIRPISPSSDSGSRSSSASSESAAREFFRVRLACCSGMPCTMSIRNAGSNEAIRLLRVLVGWPDGDPIEDRRRLLDRRMPLRVAVASWSAWQRRRRIRSSFFLFISSISRPASPRTPFTSRIESPTLTSNMMWWEFQASIKPPSMPWTNNTEFAGTKSMPSGEPSLLSNTTLNCGNRGLGLLNIACSSCSESSKSASSMSCKRTRFPSRVSRARRNMFMICAKRESAPSAALLTAA